jgi:hypothetical protein
MHFAINTYIFLDVYKLFSTRCTRTLEDKYLLRDYEGKAAPVLVHHAV